MVSARLTLAALVPLLDERGHRRPARRLVAVRRRANKCDGFSLVLAEDSCPALAAPAILTVRFGLEPLAK